MIAGVTNDYALPRTHAEARRLELQAEMLRSATEAILASLPIANARSCVDVGCGTGDAMSSIARFVSPEARIRGFDLDRGASQQAGCRFDVIEADAFGDAALPDEPFDLVFSRYVFHHLPDPVAGIRRLWDRVKPGGVLAIVDIDQRGTRTFPEWQPYAQIERYVRELYAKIGIDNQIGHKLPHYFVRSGVGPPDGVQAIGLIRPVPDLAEFLVLLVEMIADKLVTHGVASTADIERLRAEISTAPQQHGTYCDRPMAVGVWKQRPA